MDFRNAETHVVRMLTPVDVTVISGGRMHGVIRMQGLLSQQVSPDPESTCAINGGINHGKLLALNVASYPPEEEIIRSRWNFGNGVVNVALCARRTCPTWDHYHNISKQTWASPTDFVYKLISSATSRLLDSALTDID